jgi:hypothetical protein
MQKAECPEVSMVMSAHEVRDAIVKYINDSDIAFGEWCVGIAADPRTRLFIDYRVGKDTPWIFRDTGSEEAAMAVREFVVTTYGTRGSAADCDGTARYVYAYAVTGKAGR